MKNISKITVLIFLFLCAFSCKQKDNLSSFSKSMSDIMDNYVHNYPLKLPIENKVLENGFSYPSYHIYFFKKGKDTIMSIVRMPHYSNLEIDSYQVGIDSSLVYREANLLGYKLYKDKIPFIVFDRGSYGKKFYGDVKFTSIPDSLKFNQKNYHLRGNRKDYTIKKGKLFLID